MHTPDALTKDLTKNLALLQDTFGHSEDLNIRRLTIGSHTAQPAAVCYLRGTVDEDSLADLAIRPLHRAEGLTGPGPLTLVEMQRLVLAAAGTFPATHRAHIATAMSGGFAALFLEGEPGALLLLVPAKVGRSVEEPPSTPVVRGPREGFLESLDLNLALIRRRLATADLHVKMLRLGTRTRTQVAVLHLRGVAKDEVVQEVTYRLKCIKTDSVLESGYLEDFIQDHPNSLFPTLRHTERVDTVLGSLLEGRVAIVTDGTPFVLIAPTTFSSLLQVSEDYFQRWPVGTFIRWIRLLSTTIALTLTAAYVAIISFNQELIPFGLTLRLAGTRMGLPFPAVFEALVLEFIFEILREAGLRMPRPIGQAISIVGVLVLGEAAVRAGIVGPVMIIVVGAGALASFAVPDYSLLNALRIARFPMIFLAGTFGLFGLMWGVLLIATHLLTIRSFGVPYMSPLAPTRPRPLLQDALARGRWPLMNRRPASVAKDTLRQPREEGKR